jgi:hypothetical protein
MAYNSIALTTFQRFPGADRPRAAEGAYSIEDSHRADAIEELSRRKACVPTEEALA